MPRTRSDVPPGEPAALLPCVRPGPLGARLELHVAPHAPATRVAGLHGTALRVRLAAVPVDGRANEALLAWLAGTLGVPRRALSLVAGQAARHKRVDVALDAQALSERLRACLAPGAT